MTTQSESFNQNELEVSYYGRGHNDEIESIFTYKGIEYKVNCFYSNVEGWDFVWTDTTTNKYITEPQWFSSAIENDEFEYYEFAEIYLKPNELTICYSCKKREGEYVRESDSTRFCAVCIAGMHDLTNKGV